MPASILVVDDLEANQDVLARLLGRDGHVVRCAASGEEAILMVEAQLPDLVLLDVMMPGTDGIEVCRRLKSHPSTRLVPIVLVTALQGQEDRLRGIEAGADDLIAKPFNPLELRARVRSLIRLKRYTDDLDSAESVIMSLALTIEARDAYTDGHCQRLATYAVALGRALELDALALRALERGGVLHDIGKIAVPDAVLLKPGRLTPDEYRLMKEHTVVGDRLCAKLRVLQDVRPIIRHHHERRNGSGYPDGLQGDAIPLLAQIMGIVDVFDALTTVRPYRQPLAPAEALRELATEAEGGLLEKDLVGRFGQLVKSGRMPAVEW